MALVDGQTCEETSSIAYSQPAVDAEGLSGSCQDQRKMRRRHEEADEVSGRQRPRLLEGV